MECLVVILQLFLSKLTIFLQLCLRMLQEILIGTIHPFFACTRVSARVSAYKAFNRCLAFCNWNYISVIQVAIVVSEYPSPKVTLAVLATARGFHSLAHLAPFEITFQMSSLTNQGVAQMLLFLPELFLHHNRIMYSNFELHFVQCWN